MKDQLLQFLHELQQEKLTLSLMLTRYCPFKCDHCFYGCGPTLSREYISENTLYRVRNFFDELSRLEIQVELNLIGGEPTARLSEFERVLRTVSRWTNRDGNDIQLEMVTNGWWLHRPKTAREFFEIVAPYLPPTGDCEDGGLAIAISDDQYHRPFRPRWFPPVEQVLRGIFDPDEFDCGPYDEPLISKVIYQCWRCGEVFDQYRRKCPSCQSDDISRDFQPFMNLPTPNENGIPWIGLHGDIDASGVVPSGMRGQWGYNDLAAENKYRCYWHSSITFDPKGRLTDGCCRGPLMPFGTADDHPLVLLYLVREFQTETKPLTCIDCREMARSYSRTSSFRKLKSALAAEIQRIEETDGWFSEDPIPVFIPETKAGVPCLEGV